MIAPSPGGRHRHRRVRRVVLTVLVCIVVLFGASLPLYVFPPQSTPQRADVVFVIGPPREWRIDWAKQLMAEGRGETLMVSVPDPSGYPICREKLGYPVLCKKSSPFTTQGEARWLREEMAAHGWTRATVITVTPHVMRTRLIMDRCVPDGVQVVGRQTDLTLGDWAYQYAYQTGAFFKAFFVTNTC